MEDFIYIILVIVWLLVSFLKKKPKKDQAPKRQQPATQGETPAEQGKEMTMEDMLEDFFGGGKKKDKKEEEVARAEQVVYEDRSDDRPVFDVDPVEETAPEPVFQEYSGKGGVSDDFEFSTEGKVQTIDDLIALHKQKEAIELARDEEKYADSDTSHIPEFNLRDAVIFSEILNKKYT